MTRPGPRSKPARWSRLAAAAGAVGLSVGIANGMAVAANSSEVGASPPTVVQRIVVAAPEPIVVVVPRTADPAAAVTTNAPAAVAPPAPTPPALTPDPTPVTESSGS